MHMRRFFFEADQRRADAVFLDAEESHHVVKVLRLKPGDAVELVNGLGEIFTAEIISLSPQVETRILAERMHSEIPSGLIIGQALIRLKKIELTLQKCTELGVDAFYPFIAARSQGNLQQQYAGKNRRWQKIIEEACKQSMRSVPMHLLGLNSWSELLQKMRKEDGAVKLLFWEKEKNTSLLTVAEKIHLSKKVILLFGPEGGFTEDEIAVARRDGFQTVGLGKRILRSETAVLAAASIVQHYLGNM